MLKSVTRVLGLIGVALFGSGGVALAQAPQSTEEIASCISRNLPQGDELRSIAVITRDRTGAESVIRADVLGRTAPGGLQRTLVSFTKPVELEGSGLLIVERESGRELWMHTPEIGRRRLEPGAQQGQSLFGTGLSYEDLARLLGFVRTETANMRRLADDRIGDRPTYVLESTPAPGSSAYERIITSVDTEFCVPLEIKLYEKLRAAPRKVVTTDSDQIFPVRDIWIPHSVTLWDYRDQKRTVLHVESIMPELTLPDMVFEPETLGKYKPTIDVEITFDPIR
jgi:hypothetical protein